jgi:hypothetical protein
LQKYSAAGNRRRSLPGGQAMRFKEHGPLAGDGRLLRIGLDRPEEVSPPDLCLTPAGPFTGRISPAVVPDGRLA